jgi:cell division protein FtsL
MSNTRFLMMFCLAVVSSVAAFVVHLALRNQNIAMGYEVEHARNDGLRLRSQINQVRIELAARRSPAVLETIGRDELGMVDPDRVPTLVAGGTTRPPRLSGRPQ